VEWAWEVNLGWSFASHHSRQELTAASGTTYTVRRTNTSPLSAEFALRIAPPLESWIPRLGLALEAGFRTGEAEVATDNSALALAHVSMREFSVAALPAFRVWSSATQGVRVLAGARFRLADQLTLDSAQTSVDLSRRQVLWGTAGLEYQYRPGVRWRADLSAFGSMSLSATSELTDVAAALKAWEARARVVRYLGEGHGLGFGASFHSETGNWERTAPIALKEKAELEEVVLSVFYHKEL
jgi:hypothetical protein